MDERFLILAVDHNAGSRHRLRDLLARMPEIDLVEAASGARALALTLEYDFNLILLDVQMPDMDGYETASRLQMAARTRDIPVIFLTEAFRPEEFIKRGYAVGAVDYLTKPPDDNILLNRLRHYRHRKEQETRLLAAMAQTRTMQDSLLQSEQLSALGAMVASVSHELNTPLGNTKLALSTLLSRVNDINSLFLAGTLKRSDVDNFIGESLDIATLASRSLERALDLVVTFKQVAMDQTSGRQRLFDLATIVGETITSLSPSFRHDPWKFVIDVPAGIQMDSYPGPLEQIIINLVQNSIRHGFDGRSQGCITIRAVVDETGPDGKPDSVTITFADDGIGIMESNLEKIFEPFFTTRLGRGGSGIGLNITRRIATSMLGGEIKVQSEPDIGTAFILRIPCRVGTAV